MSDLPAVPRNVPPEIVYEILTYQFRDYMSNDQPSTSEKFNENLRNFLRSNLTVDKTFYHICRVLIYRYCNLTTAKRFHSLLSTIQHRPELRNIIQVADFQELTSIGLGRTGEMNRQIKNLTNHTLMQFLELTKGNLREFLACEHIQDDLDDKIIRFLFKPGKVLSILDFCGCSGPSFTKSFILALRKLYEQSYSAESSRSNLATTDDDNISIASFSTMNSTDISEIEDEDFHFAPDDMNLAVMPLECNYQITCLGLNDCTDLPNFVLGRLLKLLPDLQKLDLSRTSIDDNVLINVLPHWTNLSHFSLANCSQITPRAILEFFSHHPAVTDENNESTLEWLNLNTIAHSTSWTETHTMFLLKKLCQFGHNRTLEYLNIGGLPLHLISEVVRPPLSRGNSMSRVSLYDDSGSPSLSNPIYDTVTRSKYYYQCADTLIFIKLNFPNLKSLSIRGNNVPIPKIVELLTPMDSNDLALDVFADMPQQQRLKFLNISNNSYINKWTIQDPSIIACSESLVAVEVSFEAWQQIEKANSDNEMTFMKYDKDTGATHTVKWKCYLDASYGRRYWLYKTDKYLNREDINSTESNLTQFDAHGNKIIKVFKQPDFLKFAQSKISLSCGLVTKSSYRRKHCYRDVKPPISQFLTRNGGITFGNTFQPVVRPVLPPGGWRILPEDHTDDEMEYDSLGEEDESMMMAGSNDTTLTSGDRDVVDTRRVTPTGSHDHEHHSNSTGAGSLGNALFWDRSMHDLPTLGRPALPTAPDDPISTIQSARFPQNMRPPVTPLGLRHAPVPVPVPAQQHDPLEDSESNDEYLNNPELQRRRSQMQLGFMRTRSQSHLHLHGPGMLSNPRVRTISGESSSASSGSVSSQDPKHTAKRRASAAYKGYYYDHPDEFLYDPTDDVTSLRYRLHLQQVHEYRTFGCIERGMYRYYSLKM
ncbi:Lug1 protein [Maudiozyma humilis]|uniref:Lug1 protein n=1 Tax=Maudiozyma humilis TaxID=51915 RepID=A0AAV5S0G9_MAUHU|nr:Lug1 protein [Kazachstania humilis]